MYSRKTISKFVQLKAKNIPLKKIANELNVSERTLNNWTKKYYNEILYQKQIDLDLLKEKLNIADSQHLEFYSKIIEKCKSIFLLTDLEKADCADLFKIFNLAVNQVQKCKYMDVNNISFYDDSKTKNNTNSMFIAPLYPWLR